jgi:hypothetical protein
MIIKQILFIEMVFMSFLLSVFFALAAVDNNNAKQVSHNTETTAKSTQADQPISTYIYTNGGVYQAPKKAQP